MARSSRRGANLLCGITVVGGRGEHLGGENFPAYDMDAHVCSGHERLNCTGLKRIRCRRERSASSEGLNYGASTADGFVDHPLWRARNSRTNAGSFVMSVSGTSKP